MTDRLPIYAVLPDVLAVLREGTGAVLIAPPGTGKTTAVAPALLGEEWCSGTVIVTSPRRVAARAAAERMAELLDEPVGRTVGYATRLDSRQSAATRVLVVSEAILVRRIIDDPELPGVSAILFDEAHERHLDTDLALALALDARSALREDLRLLVMSATIDGKRFTDLLGGRTPVVASEGKAHPLAIRWLGGSPADRIEDAVTRAVLTAWREQDGDILAFLPGVREIARTREVLESRLSDAVILPLHGQVEPAGQRAAIRRNPGGRRRVVLATSIAETSLTLDGVSAVVDSGLARRAEFDRAAGTTHLVTVRASQAAAAQRAGRAARQGPGTVYRLWEEAAHAGRPAFDPPEITTSDLAPMLLALSDWGVGDPSSLAWLDPPPAASLAAARRALEALGALDNGGRITPEGKRMASLPLDPQGAAMILFGARHGVAGTAARLALLLQEKGLGGSSVDLAARLARWNSANDIRAVASRDLANRWARQAERLVGAVDSPAGVQPPPGAVVASGRPAFIAKRRDAGGEHWLSAGGRGFVLDPADPLAREQFLVIGDAQGQAQGARITSAAGLTEEDLRRWFAERVVSRPLVRWRDGRVEARLEQRLGAITLHTAHDPAPDHRAITGLLVEKAVDNLAALLPQELLARGRFAGVGELFPETLRENAAEWLEPLLTGRLDLKLDRAQIEKALLDRLGWEERQRLQAAAPEMFSTPAGTRHTIQYTGPDAPSVKLRVQAMFGLDAHPLVGTTALLLKLTSPAGRPIQATRDLPGFWRGSWRDVVKDMKGRYPRHRWPDEPWREAASLKTKNAFAARPS